MKAYIVDYNAEQQTSDVLVEFVKQTKSGIYTEGQIPRECKVEDSEDYLLDYSNLEKENEGVIFLGLCY